MLTLTCEVFMKTILLVEDDATLNRNIAFALEAEGYNVITADNVQNGLALADKANLILLDVMLPDGSGLDFCERLQSSSSVPVIFLTSCDEEKDILKGFDCGCDDYITKPFRLKVLISRIRAVFRRCAPELPDNIELTAVEQKLLEYLMINKEHFLTREQLLEYLWDSKGCFVNDNTLSVNISRLRDKLRSSSSGQIVTKRGMGYKWTDSTN